MDEKQLEALMWWVEALNHAKADPGCAFSSRIEGRARSLLRNSFGLHQHEDGSGDFYHKDYDYAQK